MKFVNLLTISSSLIISAVPCALSFQLPRSVPIKTLCRSSTGTNCRTDTVLPGVDEFEQWFRRVEGAVCHPNVKHQTFGTLRGLEYVGRLTESQTTVANVPSSIVLQSDYRKPDWDAQLACQLCWELEQGDQSFIAGYLRLLTQGTYSINVSTAPNALRHWTEEQKARLLEGPAGRQLVEVERKQTRVWKEKYEALNEPKPEYQAFCWGMEVVHSRAFCGVETVSSMSILPSIAAPVVAAVLGWAYTFQTIQPSPLVLYGLAFAAAAPTVWSLLSPGDPSTSVLLPLIDSANHDETADSKIELDPLKKSFQLIISPSCLKKESGGQQMYISYGTKSDAELLLNHGFLAATRCDNGEDGPARDEQRKALANMFLASNA